MLGDDVLIPCATLFDKRHKKEMNGMESAEVRVGTLGWGYSDWSGVFYPSEAASREYIRLYAQTFNTVEVDSTFYGTPRPTLVEHWRKVTPDNFLFCPKVPRQITHDLRLVNAARPFDDFVEVICGLGPRLGPMLLQMPPDFTQEEIGSLRNFLPSLRQAGRESLQVALEVRHRSLLTPEVTDLLKEYNVALAATDYISVPRQFTITADIAYVRLIGRHNSYPEYRAPQVDRTNDLELWRESIEAGLPRVSAMHIFCSNDYEGFGPATANKLKTVLGLPTSGPPPDPQGSLF